MSLEEDPIITEYEIYVYDYHGDADQALGDPDAMLVTVKAGTPERAMDIASLQGPPFDVDIGESDDEFCGYVEFEDVPKEALSIGRNGR